MKIQSISLIAPMLLALTACGGDDSGSNDTTGVTTAATTTATDTGTATTPGTGDTAPATDSGDTSSCMPVEKTCMQGCEQLYDCGVENSNCMFTGEADEKTAFVDACIVNPLCDTLVNLVNECDCAATVMTISGASTDFADSCANGISAGTGSGGSDSGGADSSTGG
jgi:hypothetical protein